jgi:hypothetical protein
MRRFVEFGKDLSQEVYINVDMQCYSISNGSASVDRETATCRFEICLVSFCFTFRIIHLPDPDWSALQLVLESLQIATLSPGLAKHDI